jgi:hypothetical protein
MMRAGTLQALRWGSLDLSILDFSNGRKAQKRKYFGEFFPAQMPGGRKRKTVSGVLPG